jgi:S1-C subfamily serine protease
MIRNAFVSVACVLAAVTVAAAQTVADVFDKVKDSVVVIRTVQKEIAPDRDGFVSIGGLGSGVLIDPEGNVLTAAHVVQTAEKVEVEFPSGEKISARVITAQQLADIALIRIERLPKNPVFAKLGNSDAVRVGDQVIVVGAPMGISHSLSVGHIGGRRKANVLFGGLSEAEILQTDAAINTGNSGGPMFDMNGQVVGIVSSILSRSGGFEGIGFAIASNTAQKIAADRIPWSGMEAMLIGGPAAAILNLPQPVGLLIQKIAAGSPADRLGLRAGSIRAELEGEEILLGGDILLAVGGIRLSDEKAAPRILDLLRTAPEGEKMAVTVLRAGKLYEMEYVVPAR